MFGPADTQLVSSHATVCVSMEQLSEIACIGDIELPAIFSESLEPGMHAGHWAGGDSVTLIGSDTGHELTKAWCVFGHVAVAATKRSRIASSCNAPPMLQASEAANVAATAVSQSLWVDGLGLPVG